MVYKLRVKVDGSSTKTYTVTNNTEVFKGNSSVDLSTLYVGDRVRLKFATANTSRIAEINIMSTANMVEDLYKANLNTVNTNKNTLNVKNAHPFTKLALWNSKIRNHKQHLILRIIQAFM